MHFDLTTADWERKLKFVEQLHEAAARGRLCAARDCLAVSRFAFRASPVDGGPERELGLCGEHARELRRLLKVAPRIPLSGGQHWHFQGERRLSTRETLHGPGLDDELADD